MATSNLVIDTSIIIEHLRKQDKRNSVLFKIFKQYGLYVPTVVEFEMFSGATTPQKQQDIEEILERCRILPFTSDVARQAGTILQTLRPLNQLIGTCDILIAATAITHNLPLMTLNRNHFQRFNTLRLISPPV